MPPTASSSELDAGRLLQLEDALLHTDAVSHVSIRVVFHQTTSPELAIPVRQSARGHPELLVAQNRQRHIRTKQLPFLYRVGNKQLSHFK